MRQPARAQLGAAGQTAVKQFFEDISWGPTEVSAHDLGTDLFVAIRTRDRVDLGLLLGVQVKTGDSWFGEPASVGEQSGWWFREADDSHKDYWANHHVPHILVMQDEHRQRRVWARLDATTVESTGAGIRVFVPENQPLSESAAEALTEYAAEARTRPAFEGSRWSFSVSSVPEEEWPRYALLASRIVAPHANRGISEDINWAEATALCIQAELQRWDRFAEQRADVPTAAQARESTSPGWRFAGAVHAWLSGDTVPLESLDPNSMSPELRVAHAVCVSGIREDRGDIDGAIDVLVALRDPGELTVDQAWLAVQLAGLLREQGRHAEAEEAAQASVALHAAFRSSLPVSAIRSAGILALFEMSPFTGDLAAAVQASDSTLAWWTTQQIENALNDFLRRSFQAWGRDQSVTVGGADTTHNDLLSAGLSSRLAGNRRTYRYASFLRAIAGLALPSGNHVTPASQLELLRRVGHRNELALALRRFKADGPLSVLDNYMADVTVARSTTSSIQADLQSVEIAGAYLPMDAAQTWIRLLTETFEDPSDFEARFKPGFEVRHRALEALVGLMPFFDADQAEHMIQTVCAIDPDDTQLLERPLGRLLQSLPDDVRMARASELAARGRALPGDSWLRRLLIGAVAVSDHVARELVHEQIMSGSLAGIPPNFRITDLTSEEALAILAASRRQIQTYAGQLNRIGIGGPDAYRVTALIAMYGAPEARDEAWILAIESLGEANVIHERKTEALLLLAAESDEIPSEHRAALRSVADTLRSVASAPHFGIMTSSQLRPVAPAAQELYLELADEDDEWRQALIVLMSGESRRRRAAADVLSRRSGHELTLLALTQDPDIEVGRVAMRGLAHRAAQDADVARIVVGPLLQLIDTGGEQTALQIGSGILQAPGRSAEIAPVVERLRTHPSLNIRRQANAFN